MTETRHVWGIVPAAGRGSRIQPLGFSKELLPLAARTEEGGERPLIANGVVRAEGDELAEKGDEIRRRCSAQAVSIRASHGALLSPSRRQARVMLVRCSGVLECRSTSV